MPFLNLFHLSTFSPKLHCIRLCSFDLNESIVSFIIYIFVQTLHLPSRWPRACVSRLLGQEKCIVGEDGLVEGPRQLLLKRPVSAFFTRCSRRETDQHVRLAQGAVLFRKKRMTKPEK